MKYEAADAGAVCRPPLFAVVRSAGKDGTGGIIGTWTCWPPRLLGMFEQDDDGAGDLSIGCSGFHCASAWVSLGVA